MCSPAGQSPVNFRVVSLKCARASKAPSLPWNGQPSRSPPMAMRPCVDGAGDQCAVEPVRSSWASSGAAARIASPSPRSTGRGWRRGRASACCRRPGIPVAGARRCPGRSPTTRRPCVPSVQPRPSRHSASVPSSSQVQRLPQPDRPAQVHRRWSPAATRRRARRTRAGPRRRTRRAAARTVARRSPLTARRAAHGAVAPAFHVQALQPRLRVRLRQEQAQPRRQAIAQAEQRGERRQVEVVAVQQQVASALRAQAGRVARPCRPASPAGAAPTGASRSRWHPSARARRTRSSAHAQRTRRLADLQGRHRAQRALRARRPAA